MALITLIDAQLAFGHVALLDHAGFSLDTDERVGLTISGVSRPRLGELVAGIATREHVEHARERRAG